MHDIDSLIVIGGDGSLTGANILRQEWQEHVDTLLEQGDITARNRRRNIPIWPLPAWSAPLTTTCTAPT